MAAAKFLALLALLQLTAAWHLPPQAENFTFDNETANCSGSTYEEWLEVQPMPVFVDVFPNASEAEEAEEVEDYVEPVVEIDEDVDPTDSESTDEDGGDEDGVEEVYDEGDDMQDFIVSDDVAINRFRRDLIGEDIHPTDVADQVEDSDENDAIKDSSEENGNEAMSSEEESNEEDSSEESKEDSEEEKDEPYAFLRVKVDRSSEGLLAPQERVKVMLKNFQKGRMNFFVTASAYEQTDVETTGSFASQPFLIKLRGCWLQHKHNAHNVCKHRHGRKHHHGRRGRRHHGRGRHHRGEHHHGENDHGEHHHGEHLHGENDHDENDHGEQHQGEYHHGEHHHGEHHHGEHHHGEQHHGEDHRERHPLAEANEVDTESGREQEDNTAFDFKSHKFLEPAEGEASLCSPTQLEGWLGPESKMVIAYSAPTRGCIVFRAHVSYPIHNGSLVLTAEGNAEYLESLICVQPNPIPQEDEYDEYDEESIDIVDYSDTDGNETTVVDNNITSDEEEEEEDDEEDSFTPRRGRAGYSLRTRPTVNREPDSSEAVIDDDETDEDYVPDFLQQDRNRRSPGEMGHRQLRRQERRQMRQARKEERRLLRRGNSHRRRDAGDDPSSPAANGVEQTGRPALNARQQRRQQKKEQRRLQRQERRQGRQGAGASDATSEATGTEGRRGRGGRRNRPDRPNRRNRQPGVNNRRLHSNLTDPGSKFCCKQGIQHKKASTYADDDGTTPELNCSVVPDEVPSWASHKHPITKEDCEGQYQRCCTQFDLELWKAFQGRREARRAQRESRHRG